MPALAFMIAAGSDGPTHGDTPQSQLSAIEVDSSLITSRKDGRRWRVDLFEQHDEGVREIQLHHL